MHPGNVLLFATVCGIKLILSFRPPKEIRTMKKNVIGRKGDGEKVTVKKRFSACTAREFSYPFSGTIDSLNPNACKSAS